MVDTTTVDFLVRAAREFRRGGWVFTGFHWPVLAGQTAHALSGEAFTQVFEAGVSAHQAGRQVPTSTTDYTAFENAFGYLGDTASVLLAGAQKFDRVVLDASNVDLGGRVNSSFIGSNRARPKVRLPGGGGAPDIAARARRLIWLNGGDDVRRIRHRLDHVTAAPGRGSYVELHTRWGVVELGSAPILREIVEVPGVDGFVTHLQSLGVEMGEARERPPVSDSEREAALAVLGEARKRGYQVAKRAFRDSQHG